MVSYFLKSSHLQYLPQEKRCTVLAERAQLPSGVIAARAPLIAFAREKP
jgi:hypothetical protein